MKSKISFFRRALLDPFLHFIHDSRSVGILLLCCTFFSLWLSNSSGASAYFAILHWSTPTIPALHLPHNLIDWINDGGMALFFFLVGMEIKREVTTGELSSFSKAILPMMAAIGGMVVPALIFACFNQSTQYSNGWGIPMATDIAFSLGAASLLGKRVPLGLKVFLTALAIIDDLGAILAIAVFYSSSIHGGYLLAAGCIMAAQWFFLKKGRFNWISVVLAILLWYCFFNAGIHATIAGVISAAFVPAKAIPELELRLHSTVNFIILPIFALANTAIALPTDIAASFNSSLHWGIVIGLVLGKPIGILLAAWIAVKIKWADLPTHTNWFHLAGAGILAGIGFTMSIFIATLAFTDSALVDASKMAVLLASFGSILLGLAWLRIFGKALTR